MRERTSISVFGVDQVRSVVTENSGFSICETSERQACPPTAFGQRAA
ncbi:MAG: hypothetical protein ACI4UY_02065 [Kiritimatiellia bacterium]